MPLLLTLTLLAAQANVHTPGPLELPGGEWTVSSRGYAPFNSYAGENIALLDDLDGDGFVDPLLVGKSAYLSASTACVIAEDGSLLWSRTAPLQVFHADFDTVDDATGDGLRDIVFAFASGPGQLLSGADGSPVSAFGAGERVAAVGDVDGDGSPDVAFAQAGGVRLHQATTGATIRTLPLPPGHAADDLCGYGDHDGDGIDDVVVASKGSPCRVAILSGLDGSVLLAADVFPNASFLDRVGVAAGGDVDGDGSDDLVVHLDSAARIRVVSGADGSILTGRDLPLGWGRNASISGDLDGDGLDDLAFGSSAGLGTPQSAGEVFALRSSDGAPVFHRLGGAFDEIGIDVLLVPDRDGDGRDELLFSSAQTVSGGRGFRHFATYDPWLTTSARELRLTSGLPLQLHLEFPASEAGRAYFVAASLDGAGPTLVGGFALPLANDPILAAMLTGWQPFFLHDGNGLLDAQGKATAELLPALPLVPLLLETLHVAAVTFESGLGSTPRLSSASVVVEIVP